MTRLPSIRLRLARALLRASVVWGLALAGAVWLAVQHELNHLLDETLQASAEVLGALVPHAAGAPPALPGGGIAWQVVGPGGQVLQRSAWAPAAALRPAPVAGFGDVDHGRVFGLALRDDGTMLVLHERAFTAHAAHALRTPLAGIDAQLALALRESPPSLQPRLQRARDAAMRLQRVVAALLALFRTGGELQRAPVDVGALLARLPIDGVAVQPPLHTSLEADADLLAAALLNLLDNSLRHGARHVAVSVPAPGTLRLHDDGPGVPAARRRELQAALDQQAYAGRTGLGLMLADLVARSHGGALTLADVERGFAVDLRLS